MAPSLRALVPCLAAALLAGPAAAGEALPRPASLEPAVRFWIRVYTEADELGGFVHDSEDLSIVYEVVRFQPSESRRARERRVERVKKRYRAALRSLASGKRTGLNDDERRALSRFPEGVSNATLRSASRNLRFQLGQADKFREGLARAGRWREYIEQVLAQHDVPIELSALPHVESSYNPKAYSRVGAAGMWQFTRSTGRLYMRVDHVVDERLDPLRSSIAAARLLRDNYRRTQSWPLAITAYNHGVAGMERAVRRVGTRDIGQIVRRYKSRTFGFASRNFYASFLAALEVDRNAERFFGPLHPQVPVAYEEVELPHFYRVDSLVRAFGVDADVIREHNPALRPSVWNGSKYVPQGFRLRLPRRSEGTPVNVALASIPAHERLAEQHRDRFYKVRRGDTLSRIAGRYSVRERELVALNNLKSRHRIRVGQVLVLPDDAGGMAVAQATPPADGVYRVRRGDTISTIARRYGISEHALVAENGLRNKNLLSVGQRLRLPGLAPAPTAAPKPPVQVAVATPAPAPTPAPEPAPVAPPRPAPVTVAALPSPAERAAEAAAEEAVAEEMEDEVEEAEVEPFEAAAEDDETEESTAADDGRAEIEVAETDEAEEATADELEAAEPQAKPAGDDGDRQLVVSDPSDYSVTNGRVVVQADETLGHYAEWLEVRASDLRRLNGLRYGRPVLIGRRVKLDFRRVPPETFEQRRLAYHRSLQEEFFEAWHVTGTEHHVLRRGESLWYLAEKKYRVPVWLLRQYNPDVDLAALPAGHRLVIPVVEPREG